MQYIVDLNLKPLVSLCFIEAMFSRGWFSRLTFLEEICLSDALSSLNNLCFFKDKALFIFVDVCYLLFAE